MGHIGAEKHGGCVLHCLKAFVFDDSVDTS